MKFTTISALIVLCSAGVAFAADEPSGRPGQVLDDAACEKAWNAASPEGDTLSEEKARPYILNFASVDTSNDSKISKQEWQKGCNKGWISADAKGASQSGEMKKPSEMQSTE